MSDSKFLEPVLKSTTCEFSYIVTDQDSGYAIKACCTVVAFLVGMGMASAHPVRWLIHMRR